MLVPLVEVSRKPGIIVLRNEEFMIAALLMCEAVVLWEISRLVRESCPIATIPD
jgi:hypothetical protein